MKPIFFHGFLIPICLFSVLVFAGDESFEKIIIQAEKGDVSSQFKLGIMYFKGRETSQDYKEALKWFQRAAEQGLSEAQHNMGFMYLEGKGVSKNYAEALKWFNKAAMQNNRKSQYNLGVIYSSGIGIQQDNIKAYAWMSLAYSNGYEQAKDHILFLNKTMTASEMQKAEAETAEIRKKIKY
ncbi:MAG: sel1 repeat family protein [Deltaproteobacteria bacterium]|jgi:TPR repeat protein|nr:sel1 repeat family protein [Deltaproteobacteria bacterium]